MEDRCIRADAERQRERGNGEEAGIQPQQSNGVAKILPQRVYKPDGVHFANRLLNPGDIAELAMCRPDRFLAIQTCRDVVFDLLS